MECLGRNWLGFWLGGTACLLIIGMGLPGCSSGVYDGGESGGAQSIGGSTGTGSKSGSAGPGGPTSGSGGTPSNFGGTGGAAGNAGGGSGGCVVGEPCSPAACMNGVTQCSASGQTCAPTGNQPPGQACARADGSPGQCDASGACACAPSCTQCGGDDGCGGVCMTGSCAGPQDQCNSGTCVCQSTCLTCGGDDGCGNICTTGACGGGAQYQCSNGSCVCVPKCTSCGGSNGCGGKCATGTCPSGQSCKSGTCTHCTDPNYPLYCISTAGNACWKANTDCSTVMKQCSDFAPNGQPICKLVACIVGYKWGNNSVPPTCVKK